jgi:TonB family protein
MLHQPTPAPFRTRKMSIAGSTAVIFIGLIIQSGPDLMAQQTDTARASEKMTTVYTKPAEPLSSNPAQEKYEADIVTTSSDKITVYKEPAAGPSAAHSILQTDTDGSSLETVTVQTKDHKTPQSFDQMPEFPGGDKALKKYMRTLSYPTRSREQGITGSVYVSFVVAEDGSVGDVKILKGLNRECNEEVLNFIRRSPKWKPATLDGKPVPCTFILPVRFNY